MRMDDLNFTDDSKKEISVKQQQWRQDDKLFHEGGVKVGAGNTVS